MGMSQRPDAGIMRKTVEGGLMAEKPRRCHVCGREGALSFEHIPPKSMGNNHGVRAYRGVDIIERAGGF